MRVIVPFGRSKLYSALVVRVHKDTPQVTPKYVLDIIDDKPVVSERQYRLWQWIAEYYMCTVGEVMAAALPSALKLALRNASPSAPFFQWGCYDLERV